MGLCPVPQELNAIDWKSKLSEKYLVSFEYQRNGTWIDDYGYAKFTTDFRAAIDMAKTYATFCFPQDLDFSESELCAYIASGFNRYTNQALLTRVKDVPAGIGVFLIGTSGKTYRIPYSETASYYVNLFRANLEQSMIYATSDDTGNYIFGEADNAPGFYPIAEKLCGTACTVV